MTDRVKVALVGISGYGDVYVTTLLESLRNQTVELVGAVDPVPHRCRKLKDLESAGVKIYPTLESLYTETRPDLTMIASPIHLHADQACFSLLRHSHVLTEKPLATSIKDARRIMETESRAKRFVAVGFQWSFTKTIQDLKRDIMSGKFGKPLRFKSMVSFPRGFDYYSRNDWAGRRHSPKGVPIFDSPVNNAAAHYIHNMLYLLGDQVDTSAIPATVQAELYRANQIENCDTAMLRCRTTAGVEVMFYTTHTVRAVVGPMSRYEFENAVIRYDTANGEGFVAELSTGEKISYGEPRYERTQGILQSIDCVRNNNPHPVCGSRAALSHAICVAASHASMPDVHHFPAPMHTKEAAEKGPMIAVSGLHEAMVQCYESWKLPCETGKYDWSATGRIVDCSNDKELDVTSHPKVDISIDPRIRRQPISAGEA